MDIQQAIDILKLDYHLFKYNAAELVASEIAKGKSEVEKRNVIKFLLEMPLTEHETFDTVKCDLDNCFMEYGTY